MVVVIFLIVAESPIFGPWEPLQVGPRSFWHDRSCGLGWVGDVLEVRLTSFPSVTMGAKHWCQLRPMWQCTQHSQPWLGPIKLRNDRGWGGRRMTQILRNSLIVPFREKEQLGNTIRERPPSSDLYYFLPKLLDSALLIFHFNPLQTIPNPVSDKFTEPQSSPRHPLAQIAFSDIYLISNGIKHF